MHADVRRRITLLASTTGGTIQGVASVEKIIQVMRRTQSVSCNDLLRVCEHHFGQPRQSGTSHAVFKMPWAGDPRVNIQNNKGKAKPHQVRQVLAAIDRK